MKDAKPPVEPPIGSREALLDIQTLARAASESGDMAVMQRDVEMTIAEMLLPRRRKPRLVGTADPVQTGGRPAVPCRTHSGPLTETPPEAQFPPPARPAPAGEQINSTWWRFRALMRCVA